MNAATRLALYGAGLVLAFGAAFLLGGWLVPDSVVENWKHSSMTSEHDS